MAEVTTVEVKEVINRMADVIISNEIYFCELDSVAGDGDFGMSIAKGFKQLKKEWDDLSTDNIGAFLKDCGMIIMESQGSLCIRKRTSDQIFRMVSKI